MKSYGPKLERPYQCFMGRWEGMCKTFGAKGEYLEASAVHMDVYWVDDVSWHLHEHFENLYEIPYAELRSRGLETLPSNLLDATEELEGDDVLRAALGRGRDEDYVDYFIRVKRDEWARYHEQVTPWEIREYLTRF